MSAIAPWLRVAAIAIAIAGLIDPAFTRSSSQKPDVSLVVSGPLPDPGLADRVARALEPVATVVRGPSIGAAAIVSVGYQLPHDSTRGNSAAFAIVPVARTPFLSIEAIRAPERANLQSRVPIGVSVRARAAERRSMVVQLEIDGVAIDRATHVLTKDDEVVTVELGLVSAAAGRIAPTVTARIESDPAMARADLTVRLGSDRHDVLLFDRRPSWMSTFVRRALEADARFRVTSRISTSRNASVAAGQPPATLSGLDAFDLVIVGAPDLMTAADADGLDRYMRDRGGSVLVLMDSATENAAVAQLTGISRWTRANRPEPGGAPLASEFQTPASLPRWAEPIAFARPATKDGVASIWQTAIGRGRLIVSGTLDAWRYRDKDASFDRFWRLLATDVTMEVTEERPGGRSGVTEGTGTERRATPDEQVMLRAWTSSHRGAVFAETELASLAPTLQRALAPPVETRSIHLMRSAWWIVPFAALLGIEWWDRRKNGRQ